MDQMTADRRMISGAGLANRQPRLVPTLTDLLADMGRVGDLPIEQVPALLAEVAAALVTLAARLSAAPPAKISKPAGTFRERARWLTPDEAATRLRTTRKWVYRHQEELQAQRLSRKCLRIPLRAVERMLGTNED
jgi:hypothetical protein